MMSGLHASVVTLVAVLCAVVGASLLRVRRGSPVRSLAGAWPQTRGTILSATVQVNHSGQSRNEAPLVLYGYQVNGQMFQGHRVRVSGQCVNASETLARYPPGSSVVVYYDPSDPSISALER